MNDTYLDSSEEGLSRRRPHDSPDKNLIENVPPPIRRLYHLDWLRTISISLVIMVHCMVNSYSALEYEESETSDVL